MNLIHLKNKADSQKNQQNVIRTYKDRSLEDLHDSYAWSDIESAYNYIEIIEKRHWSVFTDKDY